MLNSPPLEVVVLNTFWSVPVNCRLTVALGTAAPDASTTNPVTRPATCAHSAIAPKHNTSRMFFFIFPFFPLSPTQLTSRREDRYERRNALPTSGSLRFPHKAKREA